VVERSGTRLESLLLPPKNLSDASGRAARFYLRPPTGSATATSDVEIAGYRVKADTALLFGRLAVQRERTLLESLLAFKPDRFSPESANSRGGPIRARICRRGRPPRR
jgi:hypothetical protein